MKRVLVLDDDVMTLDYCHAILTSSKSDKYDVTLSNDPIEAFKNLTNKPVSLVVADITMPKFNGFTFLRAAKELLNFNTPFLMLSGKRDESSIRTALELGACDYVIKPVDPDIFLGKVKNILAKQDNKILNQELVSHQIDVQMLAEVEIPIVAAAVRSISELGIVLGFQNPIDSNISIRVSSPLFKEIGLKQMILRVGTGRRNDHVKEFPYEYLIKFIALEEESAQKIRRWILSKAAQLPRPGRQ